MKIRYLIMILFAVFLRPAFAVSAEDPTSVDNIQRIGHLTIAVGATIPDNQTGPYDQMSGESVRTDGSTIHWSLDNSLVGQAQDLVLIAQGSGCDSPLANENVQLLGSIFDELMVLTIEKYGVKPGDAPVDPIEDCSAEYYANNTISQRVDDAVQVLEELQSRQIWNGDLALFGGSSGGAVVSILSARLPDTDAVVVFSAGAGQTLAESITQIVPQGVAAMLEQQFDRVGSDPDSIEILSGNSFRWWADIMDRRVSDDLLVSSAPILVVQGTLDRSSPVASARATRDAFEAAGDTRLTYWELEGLDHHMVDTSGASHMPETLNAVVQWISDQLAR